MSDQENNKIVTTTSDQKELVDTARGYAARYQLMIINGKKLLPEEVYALAHYSAATGLDALAQECYYFPGLGPTPGIAGWRRKAQEQLEHEVALSGMQIAPYFWFEYYRAEHEEAVFDEGDYAFKAVLFDSLSKKQHSMQLSEIMRELNAAGESDVYNKAVEIVGKCPEWSAVGVVRKSENFGGKEYFDRNERAKKRAEKLAIQKRFRRLRLPELQMAADYEPEDFQVSVAKPEKHEKITSGKSTNELLGFEDSDNQKNQTDQVDGEWEEQPGLPMEGE